MLQSVQTVTCDRLPEECGKDFNNGFLMPGELASIDFVFRNKRHSVGKSRLIVTGFQVKAAGFGLQVADCSIRYLF